MNTFRRQARPVKNPEILEAYIAKGNGSVPGELNIKPDSEYGVFPGTFKLGEDGKPIFRAGKFLVSVIPIHPEDFAGETRVVVKSRHQFP